MDEIELDVRLSKDGALFLLHDDTLDRIAGDDSARDLGPAAELPIARLQAAVLDSGRGVVTLAEMYEATHTAIQLEIKDPGHGPTPGAVLRGASRLCEAHDSHRLQR